MENTEPIGSATYCPEDNKLRLYVGRVPRDEYLKLRSEGWTALHKQRETGGGDFAATWTPERRDTALAYSGGYIGDEDQGPAERAADRAERFSGYRDKREGEAIGHADRYDAGPTAHGYQSEARAERAAARHDRIADRAGDQWSKAEYWQRRTAGVISHALHKAAPGVRMGRIKTIEAELRKKESKYEQAARFWDLAAQIRDMTDADEQTRRAVQFFGSVTSYREYPHPDDPSAVCTLYVHLTSERRRKITGAEACALYFTNRPRPDVENNDWANHYKLRLAYENQMIEAEGGRLASAEMVCGGFLYGKQIYKVNKSPATGRITSVAVKVARVTGWTYRVQNEPGTDYALAQFDTERLPPDAYRAPTAEELTAYEATRKAEKKAAKAAKPAPIPLINPTDADAERLQALLNQHHPDNWSSDKTPPAVARINQAQYSAASGGSYARCETVEISGGGFKVSNSYMSEHRQHFPTVAKVRMWGRRVVILSDKPQKPFPASVWHDPRPETVAWCVKHAPTVREALGASSSCGWTDQQREAMTKAQAVGLVSWRSTSQFHLTDEGAEVIGFAEAKA